VGERVRRQQSRAAFEWDGAGVGGDHVGAERGRAREDVVWREQVAGDGSRCTGDDGHDERTAVPHGDVAGSGLPVTVGVPGALTLLVGTSWWSPWLVTSAPATSMAANVITLRRMVPPTERTRL
jgi:hypothetical protein